TLAISPSLKGFGDWIEQLVAESTGKTSNGLIPVVGEHLGNPDVYGNDRIFVGIAISGETNNETDAALEKLAAAGHPVVRFLLESPYDLGAECFRWEFATAVAGAVMGIHPFNQPDVEGTKLITRKMVERYSAGRSVATQSAVMKHAYDSGEVGLHAPGVYGRGLVRLLPNEPTMTDALRAHLSQVRTGDYVALLAYVEWCEPYRRIVEKLRQGIRALTGAATTVGFGPRFLHSTGQIHKGGPQNGLYLVFSCADVVDVQVPGEAYSFGQLKTAQLLADEEMLTRRKRRYLRLHVDGDVGDGLTACSELFDEAFDQLD
ncbi:MAG: transaldolase, partial [Planctomycetaceae bacterium]